MELKIYQVDAFTNKLFGGNPAAVCPLDSWLSNELLQKIAMENNLSETAYYVANGDEYELRWFTPEAEIDLCGHATLASAYVIFQIEKSTKGKLSFNTRSGKLTVARNESGYTMNFPSDQFVKTEITSAMKEAIGIQASEAYHGKNVLMLVLNSESELLQMKPDAVKVKSLHRHGLIVTAKGNTTDFVSRCFFPNFGIEEDPATGSVHTILAPYWSQILDKKTLTAKQLSKRGADVFCKVIDDRVEISGEAILYLEGKIFLPE